MECAGRKAGRRETLLFWSVHSYAFRFACKTSVYCGLLATALKFPVSDPH